MNSTQLAMMDAGSAETIISSGVKKGPHGMMPVFSKSRSTEEISAVAQCIQSLKK